MKRFFCIMLAMLLLLGAFACTSTPQQTPEVTAPKATDAPKEPSNAPEKTAAPTEAPKPTDTPEPTEEPLPYWVFDYPYGSFKLNVPRAIENMPEDDGKSLLFADPEGQWTVRFTPLSVQQTEIHMNNLTNSTESKKDFGYYKNVVIEDRTGVYVGDAIKTTYFAFERNTDWVESTQGYTTGAREPHAYLLFDYGDVIIGEWGGLLVEIALPEKSTDPLAPVMEDNDVLTLLDGIDLIESPSSAEISFPGLTVTFPVRWNAGTNGDNTLWAGVRGATKGSIYFGSSIYADPKVAAGYISKDYRTMTFNGREWYGEVRTSSLSDSVIKSLELFTDFTELHALYMRLNLNDWTSDADFWSYTESAQFKAVMESVVCDPASFHNPEDDYKDTTGFECNNINEISAYKGEGGEIVIPAAIGQNPIVGINYRVFFKNNDITSVVVSEGITYIEGDAFRGCANLKSIVLPNSLTYIGSHAFEDCKALESVTFGNGIETIENDAFANCSALGDVLLGQSVRKIGSSAFSEAGSGAGRFVCEASGTVFMHLALSGTKFTEVSFGPNADLSDYNIMQGFKGEIVTIGEGCTAIGDYFLSDMYANDTTLLAVNVPSTLKTIGRSAFFGRKGMSSFDFSNVETLGSSAFSITGLREIVIPGTIREVSEDCFSMCGSVRLIRLEEGVEEVGPWAFSSVGCDGKTCDTYNFLSDEEVEQYRDVVHKDDPAYQQFVTVYLPSTIKKIGSGAFGGTRLEGLYLLWLTDVSQLPAVEDFDVYFTNYECVYVTPETLAACGDALNAYFSQLYKFDYWGGRVRVDEGRHHYWTDRELGIDA